MITKEIQYPYKTVILELDDCFENSIIDIGKNTTYPTIDVDAMMDNLFSIIQTDEAYSSSSRQEDIDYLLQDFFAVGEFDPSMVHQLKQSVDEVITSVIANLHRTGMFINGLQPYNFSKFINTKTIVLIQSKIFSNRDEKHPPVDTASRRDFIF